MKKHTWLLVFVFIIPAISVSSAATKDETTTKNETTVKEEATTLIRDTSGTNPLLMLRSISARYEYQHLTTNNTTSNYTTRFIYSQPTKTGAGKLSISVPRLSTNPLPDYNLNLGDIGIKYSHSMHLGDKQGMLLSTKLIVPIARGFIPGSGTWSVAPSASYVIYLGSHLIITPAYHQQLSFAGDSGKDKINLGTFDLYMAYVDTNKKWWLTSDLTVNVNYAKNQHTSSLLTFTYGRVLRKAYGGTLNGFVQPGIGMGPDRPYDWDVKAGVSIIGF